LKDIDTDMWIRIPSIKVLHSFLSAVRDGTAEVSIIFSVLNASPNQEEKRREGRRREERGGEEKRGEEKRRVGSVIVTGGERADEGRGENAGSEVGLGEMKEKRGEKL
jgi:hypothetical protein